MWSTWATEVPGAVARIRTSLILARRDLMRAVETTARPCVDGGDRAENRAPELGTDARTDARVEQLGAWLLLALCSRGHYSVSIDSLGRVGEVVISVTGSRGRLPLLFRLEELDQAYVLHVVVETLDRFGL
jgi:hypothetical protein